MGSQLNIRIIFGEYYSSREKLSIYLKTLPSSLVISIPLIALILSWLDIDELKSVGSLFTVKWLSIVIILCLITNMFTSWMVVELSGSETVYEKRVERIDTITSKTTNILYQDLTKKETMGNLFASGSMGSVLFIIYSMMGLLVLMMPGLVFMFVLLAILIIGGVITLISMGITYIIVFYLENYQGHVVSELEEERIFQIVLVIVTSIWIIIAFIKSVRMRTRKNRLINYERRLVKLTKYQKTPIRTIKIKNYYCTAMNKGEVHVWNEPDYPYAIIRTKKETIKDMVYMDPYLFVLQDKLYVWEFDYYLKFIGSANVEEDGNKLVLQYNNDHRFNLDIRSSNNNVLFLHHEGWGSFLRISDGIASLSRYELEFEGSGIKDIQDDNDDVYILMSKEYDGELDQKYHTIVHANFEYDELVILEHHRLNFVIEHPFFLSKRDLVFTNDKIHLVDRYDLSSVSEYPIDEIYTDIALVDNTLCLLVNKGTNSKDPHDQMNRIILFDILERKWMDTIYIGYKGTITGIQARNGLLSVFQKKKEILLRV